MSSPSTSLSSGTFVSSLDLDDPTMSLDFSVWELGIASQAAPWQSNANIEEFLALGNNCFIRNPHYHSHPIYQAMSPTHPQLHKFEQDMVTLTNNLAQNPLSVSIATVCTYQPRSSGMWGMGQKHPVIEPSSFPVLCLAINDKQFLGPALQQISMPIHISVSPHPIELLVGMPAGPGYQVLGPLFPGDALVGQGGKGMFGAYLYPTHPSPGEEHTLWGLSCGHVASKIDMTAHLCQGLYAPSIHDIQAPPMETIRKHKKRQTEVSAEIDVSDIRLYSHSSQMIDAILSDKISSDFDLRELKLKARYDEASSAEIKVSIDGRLKELEEDRRRCEELECIKADIELALVGTVYSGEFGYVPKSPIHNSPILLPAVTSNSGIYQQTVGLLESSCSEPIVAELQAKWMSSTDWLLLKVDRAPATGPQSWWMSTPSDITPGLPITFMSGNHNDSKGPNPQQKGIINGLKAYITNCGVVTSEWAVYSQAFGSGFGSPGDSGGVIVDSADDSPVGLIFAGNHAASCTFVKPLKFVLDRIELLTGMRMNFQPPGN